MYTTQTKQVTARKFDSENLWFDADDLPSTSPRDMSSVERQKLAAALNRDARMYGAGHASTSWHCEPASGDIRGFMQKPLEDAIGTQYGTRRKYNGM